MTYISIDGKVTKQELATHYVITCEQIEVLDQIITRASTTIQKMGRYETLDVYAIEKALEANDKAWNRRQWLVANRTEAFDALKAACSHNPQRIDELVSIAAEGIGYNIAN